MKAFTEADDSAAKYRRHIVLKIQAFPYLFTKYVSRSGMSKCVQRN